ncbi:hypothetical protein FKW77_000540 [Venturia effusa]|uniref:Uncharacterized protein n=1 Tax=Venturia effusa TaxID=50376 RepID=A0A517L8H0_9PEZI|nr:hypothetical protein FKW77_000540 [Venturia effusa]
MKARGVEEKKSSICPKCTRFFCGEDIARERAVVKACLVCEGILIEPLKNDGKNEKRKSKKGRREHCLETSAGATPEFTLPGWTREVTGRQRPVIDPNADLAPDELPTLSKQYGHVGDTAAAAQLHPHPLSEESTQSLPAESPVWNFPRRPARTPYRGQYKPPESPPIKYTLAELLEIQHIA